MIYNRLECHYKDRKTKRELLHLLFAIWFFSSRSGQESYALFSSSQTRAIVDAIVVGGVLPPHGDFALDPSFFLNGTIEREVANDVARGARRAGRWLVELGRKHHQVHTKNINHRKNNNTRRGDSYIADDKPMIVLMTTPHGIKLDYDYGIYVSSKGSGTAIIGGDCIGFRDTLEFIRRNESHNGEVISKGISNATKNDRHHCQKKPYNVTLNTIDLAPTSLAKDLITVLRQEKRHPVSGVYSYDDETPISLNWGEIVPLLLLPTTNTSTTFSSVPSSRNRVLPLIWTFPYRRYDHSVDMVPELLQVGADIMEWAQKRPEKIAIIISGDLSHTHQSNGPYGYSAASGPYDDAIGLWAGGHGYVTNGGTRHNWDPCQPEATAALLKQAKELQPNAKSCGFTGYVMWHGMMCQHPSIALPLPLLLPMKRDISGKKDRPTIFHSEVFVNRNVTYYGMIGATFKPD